MNFWDQTHPLAKDSERIGTELMPAVGNCETLQGELFRASSKIGYDWYNNGWGCNNWSGAVVFLEKHAQQFATKRTAEEHEAFIKALGEVRHYSHGERVGSLNDDDADHWVTTIHAYVVQSILDNPTPIPNTTDMLDYTEQDYRIKRNLWDEGFNDDDYDD